MSYFVSDLMGAAEREVSPRRMKQLLKSLVHSEPEHPDVSLTHESGWCLSVHSGGLIVWENVEEEGLPRHMRDVPLGKCLELWRKLAKGELVAINREPWVDGYG